MNAVSTGIGQFPQGIRRMRSAWQQDLRAFLAFAKSAGFAFVDFGPVQPDAVDLSKGAGLSVGTVDLPDWPGLISPDPGTRLSAVIATASYIRSLAGSGITKFLSVLVPADPTLSRATNMAYAIESYRSLAQAAEECGARLILEGAPGRPPHFANLACTPADLRIFLAGVNSSAVGINYDPSHLVRMGIDCVRFLNEFAGYIGHVHAKDTLFIAESQYDHGTLQQATEGSPYVYGGHCWRYVLPGRGAVPWALVMNALAATGYDGPVSIELEDADFLGDATREQAGFELARDYLINLSGRPAMKAAT